MDFREYASKETSELAARLAKAATAAADEAAQRATDEGNRVAEHLRQQLQNANKEKASTQARLKDAQTHGDRGRAELKAATERLGQLTAARDEQSAARRTAEGELRKARELADALRGELTNATK